MAGEGFALLVGLWLGESELALADGRLDDERRDLEHHLHEDLHREVVHVVLVQHRVDAGLDDRLLDLTLDKELHQEGHVAETLHTLTMLDLVRIVHKKHLLVEIFFH